jgi:hypothetical protein
MICYEWLRQDEPHLGDAKEMGNFLGRFVVFFKDRKVRKVKST